MDWLFGFIYLNGSINGNLNVQNCLFYYSLYHYSVTLNHLQPVEYSSAGTFELKPTVVPEATQGLEV